MCDRCGSMRPGNFGPTISPTTRPEPQEQQPAALPVAVLSCSECRQPLRQVMHNEFYCDTCGHPPWYQRMFRIWLCPACKSDMVAKGDTRLVCRKCGLLCRTPWT